jgi:filamentous hemagglutinin family protein
MHRPTGTLPLGVLGLCLALETAPSRAAGPAGIKLDGTLGPSAAALAGPMYAITQNLGKLSGGNLYFSFQYFNVATGETALFSTTSAGINNVISRVTGGYASTIDGTIQLQAASGAPNFFLINPSGVTFTANAVIDVPAAFYVSTANYLKFSDGNFYVDPGKMSTLSAAAPEAFGFLGTTRAPVNIEGANLSAGVNGAGDFQIAAGDVTIDGAGARAGRPRAPLKSPRSAAPARKCRCRVHSLRPMARSPSPTGVCCGRWDWGPLPEQASRSTRAAC